MKNHRVSVKLSNLAHSISKNDPVVNVEQYRVENYGVEEFQRTPRETKIVDKIRSMWRK